MNTVCGVLFDVEKGALTCEAMAAALPAVFFTASVAKVRRDPPNLEKALLEEELVDESSGAASSSLDAAAGVEAVGTVFASEVKENDKNNIL